MSIPSNSDDTEGSREASAPLVWRSGRDARHRHFDETWLEFTGRDLEDELGGGWERGIHDADIFRWRQAYQKAVNLRKSFSEEFRLRHRDGTYRWMLARCRPVFDTEGEFDGFLGRCTDITESREADESLEDYHLSFEALASMTPFGVLRFGASGLCRLVSDSWTEITGVSAKESLCEGWLEAFTPIERSVAAEYIHWCLKEKDEVTFKCRLAVEGNEETKALVHARPELSDTGLLRGAIATVRIPGQEHGDMAEDLEASKLESLGILAGGIAHDFKNLLTPIVLNISIALNQLNQPASEISRLRHRLREAQEGVARANRFAENLLSHAKPHKDKESRHCVDTANVLLQSVEVNLHGKRGVAETSIPNDLWNTVIDASQLEQILQQVMTNADTAMPEGGIIRIDAENIDDLNDPQLPSLKGRYVRIRIVDEGMGIESNVLEEILHPYFNANSQATDLGLAKALSIIRSQGGEILVESEPARGAIFSIYLPAAGPSAGETTTGTNSPSEAAVTTTATKPAAGSRSRKGKRRILVMDDEDMIRNSVKEILLALGYEVETARDGTEALKLYTEGMEKGPRIDLTLMDLTIQGGMGGEDAIAELKGLDADAVAVVCSGYSNDPIMTGFNDYGFQGAINKPFHPDELDTLITSLIGP